MPERPTVLVTGAAGYLGRRITDACRASGYDVIAHTRASGDLATADAFAAVADRDRARIGAIVHSAAVTRFNVDAETADRVNVGGTKRVIEFAQECPALEQVTLLSTVYASGLQTGRVPETLVASDRGFANHYERSKWEAESVVAASGLPWQVVRVATAIADDDTGAVTQYNAFHTTLRLCFYGLLSVLPGRADTPLYLVTGEFATAAVLAVLGGRESGVYHACHERAACATLGQAIEIAFEVFAADDEFRRKGILPPLLADEESFGVMAEGIETFGGEVVSQAMRTVSPFGPQLYVDKDVENARLRSVLDGYRAPDSRELLRAVVTNLVATRWGRRVAVA
jgi:nucleoside-diphosphate-sugar epimerase